MSGEAVTRAAVPFLGCRGPEVVQQKDSNRGREARLGSGARDFCHERMRGLALARTDLSERLPHCRLEPDTGAPPRHGDVTAAQGRYAGADRLCFDAVPRALPDDISSHACTLWQANT